MATPEEIKALLNDPEFLSFSVLQQESVMSKLGIPVDDEMRMFLQQKKSSFTPGQRPIVEHTQSHPFQTLSTLAQFHPAVGLMGGAALNVAGGALDQALGLNPQGIEQSVRSVPATIGAALANKYLPGGGGLLAQGMRLGVGAAAGEGLAQLSGAVESNPNLIAQQGLIPPAIGGALSAAKGFTRFGASLVPGAELAMGEEARRRAAQYGEQFIPAQASADAYDQLRQLDLTIPTPATAEARLKYLGQRLQNERYLPDAIDIAIAQESGLNTLQTLIKKQPELSLASREAKLQSMRADQSLESARQSLIDVQLLAQRPTVGLRQQSLDIAQTQQGVANFNMPQQAADIDVMEAERIYRNLAASSTADSELLEIARLKLDLALDKQAAARQGIPDMQAQLRVEAAQDRLNAALDRQRSLTDKVTKAQNGYLIQQEAANIARQKAFDIEDLYQSNITRIGQLTSGEDVPFEVLHRQLKDLNRSYASKVEGGGAPLGEIKDLMKAIRTDINNSPASPQLQQANALFRRELAADYLKEAAALSVQDQRGVTVVNAQSIATRVKKALEDPHGPLSGLSKQEQADVNEFYSELSRRFSPPNRLMMGMVWTGLGGAMLANSGLEGAGQFAVGGMAGLGLSYGLAQLAMSSPRTRKIFLAMLDAGGGQFSQDLLNVLVQASQQETVRGKERDIEVTPAPRSLFRSSQQPSDQSQVSPYTGLNFNQ